jgi:hypothetical protein
MNKKLIFVFIFIALIVLAKIFELDSYFTLENIKENKMY